MRFQLLLVFTLIIVIVVGISWLLAVQTTGNQFAVLISENNQRQAGLMMPLLMRSYQKLGSWEAVQQVLEEQVQFEQAWFRSFEPPTVVRPDVIEDSIWKFNQELWQDLGEQLAAEPFRPGPGEESSWAFRNESVLPDHIVIDVPLLPGLFEQVRVVPDQINPESRIIIEPNTISLMSLDLRTGRQRALVIDPAGTVVFDSERTLLGERVETSFIRSGIPLYDQDRQPIGTFMVTSREGVYTVEQTYFLQQVRRGLLTGGLLSGGVAFFLAFILAHRFTSPIRSLTSAAQYIQSGEWGYQVKARGRHEIARLAQAFNQMSQHLADQRSLRSRLVDDLAHELNTPLSLMRLEIQGMRDGLQTPEDTADHLAQEVDEVAELVADLIFLASRDMRRTPQMDWIDLNMLIANTMRRFEHIAGGRVQLEFQPAVNFPALYADADLVQRAITNLVSNAVRYTPDGGKVTLLTRTRGKNLEVMVQDTGYGISPEHLPHIFDRFYRVDESRSRTSGGRGLGLSIVKQIMDEHKGSVTVESLPGKGSQFTLSWAT